MNNTTDPIDNEVDSDFLTNNITLNNNVLKISTLNICGLCEKFKQNNLIDTIIKKNISFLGISETKLPPNQASFAFKYTIKSPYLFYSSSHHEHVLGQGVGLLIHENYAKYIHSCKTYKGRIVEVDLWMKGNCKLRIIQTYLPASHDSENRILRKDIEDQLTLHINDARSNRMHIILMGDLNADQHDLNQAMLRNDIDDNGQNINWRFNFLHKLPTLNFYDVVELTHDLTSNNPKYHTFFPPAHFRTKRLDYIWVSHDLVNNVIDTKTHDPDFCRTDHKLITLM